MSPSTDATPIRILIAEDQTLMREGLRTVLDLEPGFVVVGEAPAGEAPEPLSLREVEVLRLLAQGASNRDIADQLVLAEGTVKNHVSNILAKLHAADRTQAASLARSWGLIEATHATRDALMSDLSRP